MYFVDIFWQIQYQESAQRLLRFRVSGLVTIH